MISRHTSSVSKDVFPRILYCDSRWYQTCRRQSEGSCRCFQMCHLRSRAVPGAPKVLSGTPRCFQTYHNHSHRCLVRIIRDHRYSDGRPECPPMVQYFPDIDASKFTLFIHSDTSGSYKGLKYILLMYDEPSLFLKHPVTCTSPPASSNFLLFISPLEINAVYIFCWYPDRWFPIGKFRF